MASLLLQGTDASHPLMAAVIAKGYSSSAITYSRRAGGYILRANEIEGFRSLGRNQEEALSTISDLPTILKTRPRLIKKSETCNSGKQLVKKQKFASVFQQSAAAGKHSPRS